MLKPFHRALLVALLSLAPLGCGAPATSPSLQTSNQTTLAAKGVDQNVNKVFYGDEFGVTAMKGSSGYRFFLMVNESLNQNLDATRRLQLRLEMMEAMDAAFANILSLRKPLLFGAANYKLAVSEATLGRACYAEFAKNRDQLAAAQVHRDMFRHLVTIYRATSLAAFGNIECMPLCVKPSLFKEEKLYLFDDASVVRVEGGKFVPYTPFL